MAAAWLAALVAAWSPKVCADNVGTQTDCAVCQSFQDSLEGPDPNRLFDAERDACRRCWTARGDSRAERDAEERLRTLDERIRRLEMREPDDYR